MTDPDPGVVLEVEAATWMDAAAEVGKIERAVRADGFDVRTKSTPRRRATLRGDAYTASLILEASGSLLVVAERLVGIVRGVRDRRADVSPRVKVTIYGPDDKPLKRV